MDFNDPKNVLIIGQSTVISVGLLEIAIAEAEHGNTVWYLASKPVDKLPDIFLRKDRSILKRIIFTYCKSLEALIQKLMDLDNMFITPSLIIIESLHTFFANPLGRNAEYFLQGHAKTIASLQSCVYSFNERLKAPCCSIVSLDDQEGYSQQCLATFIDLFYYKKNYVRAADSTFVQWFEEFKINQSIGSSNDYKWNFSFDDIIRHFLGNGYNKKSTVS